MEIALNVDLSDPPRYSVTPCDEEWIDSIFSKCKEHGVKRMLWRVSLGRAYYHSRLMKPVDRDCGEYWHPVAEVVEKLDPLECAVRSAKRHGIEILAWYPFSETHISKGYVELIDPFFSKRRDLYWLSRDMSRCFLGHPCVAEPEAGDRLTAICQELSDYDVDGIFLSTRTHCTWPGIRRSAPFEPDEFGFNDPIVKEVKKRCGVDISSSLLEELAPEVIETWHRVKGEFFTSWLRDVRAVLKPRGQKLFLNIKPDRYTFIANGVKAEVCLRLYKDWETWLGDDILDGVSAVTPGSTDPGPNVASIEPFKKTCPDGSFYVWAWPIYTRPPEESTGKGMDIRNYYGRTPEVFEKMLEKIAQQGAKGTFLHAMYALLFIDSGGEDIGGGAVPREEYWPILKKWAG